MSDLISRSRAIKEVSEWATDILHPQNLIKEDAIHILESLPSVESKTWWIPVSERLPKTGDSILVTYSDGEVGIVWSAYPKVWGKYEKANHLIFPIAWIPLPEPYKGGEKDE